MLEVNKIYFGDALELLKQIDDESIDLVITDPPYNITQPNKKINRENINSRSLKRQGYKSKELNYDFGKWDEFKSKEDYLNWTEQWVKEIVRVLKPNGTLYSFFAKSEISFFEYMLKDYGMHVRSTCVWHKTNPVPLLFKVGYMSASEFFVFATKNKGAGHTFNYKLGQQHNVFTYPICQGKERTKHPTQKPLKLIEKLLLYSSNPGDLVLDPFVGSGTTAVACIRHGRNFIGFEKEKEYYDIAVKRINEEMKQKRLNIN